ncbi:NRT1/ PTR FAMILY 5.7 [Spatholobus suberectus]|nr:NRT1/ PTR FAMILY 5.7 [Spatholobus suberectus]
MLNLFQSFKLLSLIVLYPSNFIMALQQNSSEINISSVLKKKLLHPLRYLFVNSKTLPFIGCLVVSYTFVEIAVVSMLMDYLTDSMEKEDQRIAAVVTNLQDGLSSLFFVIISLISEAYTGCFTMITFCAAASIEGLMLLWTSTSASAFNAVYAAIFFLALGKSGQNLSENFLEHQLQERIKARKESEQEHGSTQNKKEQDLMDTILTNICLFAPLVVGYIITVCVAFVARDATYEDLFRFAALLMGETYLLFLFGSAWYSREEVPVESNLRKIFRIFKAAFGKRDSKYPTSPNCYYWKDYKQDHLYRRREELRLSPRVPHLFRWLDKAAIVKAEESKDPEVSPETLEKKGKLCTVKEVREVKSLVPMIYLCFAFFAYSLLLATGNTFFVSQASSLTSVITTNGNDISILFLIKAGVDDMSRFICFLISFAFRHSRKFRVIHFTSYKKAATIIRIGFGMVCGVVCSLIAWKVEVRRLSSPFIINQEGDLVHPGTTMALVPQFILLGVTEGLVDGGLASLFHGHVAKSMWSFDDSFSELVIGTGKLLIVPLVLIFSGWFKDTVDTSHLDRYYLMLTTANATFLLVFAYYSFRYAYKEECPEDEKVTMEQSFEHDNQPDSEDPNPGNNTETQPVDQAWSPLEECLEDEKIKVEETLEYVHQPNSQDSYLESTSGGGPRYTV